MNLKIITRRLTEKYKKDIYFRKVLIIMEDLK